MPKHESVALQISVCLWVSNEACMSFINSFLESSESTPRTCVDKETRFSGKQCLGILKVDGFKL